MLFNFPRVNFTSFFFDIHSSDSINILLSTPGETLDYLVMNASLYNFYDPYFVAGFRSAINHLLSAKWIDCPHYALMMMLCPLGIWNTFVNGFDVCGSQNSGYCFAPFDQS